MLTLPDFSTVHLLVAGDVMLDRYWYGNTSRISPEAPVPVVTIADTEDRPGAAANVALGLSALGVQTSLCGKIGDDEAGTTLEQLMHRHSVSCVLERSRKRPTITKLRVISHQQQMIRLDFEAEADACAALSTAAFKTALAHTDAVILSDYAKGALHAANELIMLAREAGKPILVDPKQHDFAIYRGATLITPNRFEFERAVGRCRSEAELHEKGFALLEQLDWHALLLTRGEEGMTLIERDQQPLHIPAQAHEVFDVTGAGDTVIAVTAAALAAGENLKVAARLANLAAGIVVGKLGTATVTLAELEQAINPPRLHQSQMGVINEATLLKQIDICRNRSERIVMTNGCFDILHPGHVSYLEQARQLGDRLIVAVNDDASVQRLKGPERPINTLDHRMTVLAGLGAVDWVVPFSEDTPARLINAIAPDVLVKGGDYQVEQIAGHESVLARGGQVKILPFLEANSTTDIIQRIRTGSSKR